MLLLILQLAVSKIGPWWQYYYQHLANRRKLVNEPKHLAATGATLLIRWAVSIILYGAFVWSIIARNGIR